jgi:hypothetical protein
VSDALRWLVTMRFYALMIGLGLARATGFVPSLTCGDEGIGNGPRWEGVASDEIDLHW